MITAQGNISQSAKDDLHKLLARCLETSLKTEGYSAWELQPIAKAEDFKAQEFTMLTISSYDFRMFVLLHSSYDAASKRYAADALHMAADQLTSSRYYDFLGELGNRFCGAFKRDLGACFPYTGMSTPNRMRRESLPHVKKMSATYDTHINARAHDQTSFCASLYVSLYGIKDFRLDKLPKQEEHASEGALELF